MDWNYFFSGKYPASEYMQETALPDDENFEARKQRIAQYLNSNFKPNMYSSEQLVGMLKKSRPYQEHLADKKAWKMKPITDEMLLNMAKHFNNNSGKSEGTALGKAHSPEGRAYAISDTIKSIRKY